MGHRKVVGGVGVWMRDFGVRWYQQGFEFHLDRRKRDIKGEAFVVPVRRGRRTRPRGEICGFSPRSLRRLRFILANAATRLRCLLTLTYHGTLEADESAAERNRRLVKRSKRDLNRFLNCLRRELGEYVWIMEFQARGAIHFHVVCERMMSEGRVATAWLRATNALDDPAAIRHAVKVDSVRSEPGARSYLAQYVGKGKQKELPPGVDRAGRWWGRSRGHELALLEEMVTCEAESHESDAMAQYVMRCLRRYLSKLFKRRFRGGMFVDWGGVLTNRLRAMKDRLEAEYKRMWDAHLDSLRLEEWGWEPLERVDTDESGIAVLGKPGAVADDADGANEHTGAVEQGEIFDVGTGEGADSGWWKSDEAGGSGVRMRERKDISAA